MFVKIIAYFEKRKDVRLRSAHAALPLGEINSLIAGSKMAPPSTPVLPRKSVNFH